MKRKELAKKLGITILAFLLALPCAAPMAGRMDVRAAGIPAGEQGAEGTAADEPDQAAESQSEGLQLKMKTYKKDYKTKEGRIYKTVSFEYPVAQGDSDAAKAFNKFYKSLLTKWKKAAQENLKDAQEDTAQLEDTERYYSDEVRCEITADDGKYISILQLGYDYSMGAHGMPYRYTYIFNAQTGKKVSAADLLGLSKKQLNEKVRGLFLNKFDKSYGTDEHPFYANRADVKATLEKMDFNKNLYYLKNGKVRFYADPYVVGPYAAGFIEVAVKL